MPAGTEAGERRSCGREKRGGRCPRDQQFRDPPVGAGVGRIARLADLRAVVDRQDEPSLFPGLHGREPELYLPRRTPLHVAALSGHAEASLAGGAGIPAVRSRYPCRGRDLRGDRDDDQDSQGRPAARFPRRERHRAPGGGAIHGADDPVSSGIYREQPIDTLEELGDSLKFKA